MTPDVFVPLTLYCERGTDPALDAEPMNALSNLAFFLAAAFAYARLPSPGSAIDTRAERLLIALVALVGVGSSLFHTFATPWAMAADIGPIAAFVLAYVVLASRRFVAMSWPGTAASLALVAVTQIAAHLMRCEGGPCLNGSAGYLAPVLFLILAAFAAIETCPRAAPSLFAAAAVFALSLTLRTLDLTLCETMVYLGKTRGTHALWHVLNAATLAILLDAAIKTAPPQTAGQINVERLKDCDPRPLAP